MDRLESTVRTMLAVLLVCLGALAGCGDDDNPADSEPTNLPVVETGGIYGQDPAFSTGWQIDGASPAAGAGTAVSGVVGDMHGTCYASPPSIGAYEVPE